MKEQEEKVCHILIQMCYLKINKAQRIYREIKNKQLGLDNEKTQDYMQKKAIQLGRIMQFYYPVIIENKKRLKLEWGPDQNTLYKINKMFKGAEG
jgi:hypothetical protein